MSVVFFTLWEKIDVMRMNRGMLPGSDASHVHNKF